MTFDSIISTVGRTPLLRLDRIGKGLPARITAKLEMRNPCGSVKDRVGVAMIADAERRGAGVSSGAALHAALSVAARADSHGKTIVVLLADSGERYITTSLFSRAWRIINARTFRRKTPRLAARRSEGKPIEKVREIPGEIRDCVRQLIEAEGLAKWPGPVGWVGQRGPRPSAEIKRERLDDDRSCRMACDVV